MKERSGTVLGGAARKQVACPGNMAGRRRPQQPKRAVACNGLWSVEVVLQQLRKKRLDPKTVERVYEADVYPAVFDHASWRQHRARFRYVEHCVTLFRSYFFRDLLGPLAGLVGLAVAVGSYETALADGLLPGWVPSFSGVSDTPFQLTSFALSLMLVFRTNSSYSRWLDARQQWGLLVNTARTFVRQAMTTLPEDSCPELRDAVARWTIALARLSKLHLREHGDVKEEIKGVLRGEELALVAAAPHRPLAACHVLSGLLGAAEGAGHLDSTARARLEADVSAMSQALGACEKILRNPIPLSYTRHTARFLILWLAWLPIALWAKVGWGVVPVEAILCYLLLGIDEIAIQMEEPFGILPLENFCEAVQQSVDQLAAMDPTVQGVVGSYACSLQGRGEGAAAAAAVAVFTGADGRGSAAGGGGGAMSSAAGGSGNGGNRKAAEAEARAAAEAKAAAEATAAAEAKAAAETKAAAEAKVAAALAAAASRGSVPYMPSDRC